MRGIKRLTNATHKRKETLERKLAIFSQAFHKPVYTLILSIDKFIAFKTLN